MKIHLGCGPVYLKDYINIDGKFDNHYLASDRPDLVELNKTDINHYYKKNVTRLDIENKVLIKQDVVVDMYAEDYDNLPFEKESLDEIFSSQVFEHFDYKEQEGLLEYWKSLLKIGGKLVIDIPDLDRTVDGYYHSRTQHDKDWYTRLLFGSQKNKYAYHKEMHSQTSLRRLLEKHGFKNVKLIQNIHDGLYPAFGMEGVK